MTEQEIIDKWIAALRSGKYEQGIEVLGSQFGGKETYCCLGVLCDVVGLPKEQWFDNGTELLPDEVCGLVRISTAGGFQEGLDRCLSQMNDHGKSFAEIADWLENPGNLDKLRAYYEENESI